MNAIKVLAIRAEALRVSGYFDQTSAEPVPSPCLSVCRMSPDGSHCEGCFRTLDEIRIWSDADADLRRSIWRRLLARAGIAPPPV